jgi:hypothetical protein
MRNVFFGLSLLGLVGCGSVDPAPVCDGRDAICDVPGYFPLCADPGTNSAVDEADGYYCSFNDFDELGQTYIGPTLERAPDCAGGEVQACPSGEQPTCFFLANCTVDDLPTP